MQQSLTVAILTKNEELLIERAIRSASWAAEVLVVDSGSTDKTCEIAAKLGARVVHQPWLGWRAQHKRAVDLATHEWVMKFDADEVISVELAASIQQALADSPDPRDGFVVERIDEFMGRLMPTTARRKRRDTFVRIFNRRFSVWDPNKPIHEQAKIAGSFRRLSGPLLHWRNASLSRILDTYNANAEVESKVILERSANGPSLVMLASKPVLRFGWSYFACGNWRYGTLGFIRSALQAVAEFISLAKAWEQRHAQPQLQPSAEYYQPSHSQRQN
jgi:hypothetical protein